MNDKLARLRQYLDYKGKSNREAEIELSAGNGRLGKMFKNDTELKPAFVEKILNTFTDLNKEWFETGSGEMVKTDAGNKTENTFKATPRKTQSNAKLIGDINQEEFGEGTRFRNVGNGWFSMKVELVTEKAKAGWLRGFADPEFHEELPITEVLVDFYHAGKYVAFEADGDSMDDGTINSIPHKTIIIGRELEPGQWKPRLYDHKWPNWVFVHKTEGILVKQIKDQNLEEGWILHTSLNPNKELYPDERIELKDVFKIYNVVKRILR